MNYIITVFTTTSQVTRKYNTDTMTKAVVVANARLKERFVRKVEVSVLLETFNPNG